VIPACGDLGDIPPAADIALPIGVVSHGDHAVGSKPHRVTAACGDLVDARPVADIALPVVVPSHGDRGVVGLKPHRVIEACGDLVDVRPAGADICQDQRRRQPQAHHQN